MNLIYGLLVLALIAVVPLGLRVLAANGVIPTGSPVVAAVVGGGASVGVALPASPATALMALPWLTLALAMVTLTLPTLMARGKSMSDGNRDVRLLIEAVGTTTALLFWTIGAVFVLFDRLSLDPAEVGAQLTTLTAVHFHYAGFAAAVILGTTARVRPGRWTYTALLGALTGPPLVGAGFAYLPALQVVGAAVLTAALWLWSILAAGAVSPAAGRVAIGAWGVARVSVWVGMALALWWAVGSVTGAPAPDIATMARTHGVANGLGFAVAGLFALRQVRPAGCSSTSA